jgi:oligopeptide transport system substrate-binding protein
MYRIRGDRVWLPILAVVLALFVLAGCRAKPQSVELPISPTVVVVQTVIVPQPVPAQTVPVTVTPIPTPAYTSGRHAPDGTLVYSLPAQPTSLDPQDLTGNTAAGEAGRFVLQQLDEGLFNLRADGHAEPAAAERYAMSGDLKTYTVTLRTGLRWSDGQPVTAQQYADAVCHTLDPATGGPADDALARAGHLHGATEFTIGAAADCTGIGVHALDTQRLQFDLDQPVGFLPQLLAYPPILPYRADIQAGDVAALQRNPAHLPTNGPYTLAGWTPDGAIITLVKNARYWNVTNVRIQTIELRAVPATTQQLALYEQGELDVAGVPAGAVARIQAQPAFAAELRLIPQPGISFIGLNTQISPTANLNFRRAAASAIDRDALARLVAAAPVTATITRTADASMPTAGQDLLPSGLWPITETGTLAGYPYDPAAARQFLAQAGYSAATPPPPVDIWYNREGNNPALFEAIARMLETVGIPTRLTSSSWNVYTHALNTCRATKVPASCGYGLYWMGWVMDYADASSLLAGVLAPQASLDYTGWASEAYEAALARGLATADPAQQAAAYRVAEKIALNDAVVFVPLLHYNRLQLVKAGVQFEYAPFGPPNLQYWALP